MNIRYSKLNIKLQSKSTAAECRGYNKSSCNRGTLLPRLYLTILCGVAFSGAVFGVGDGDPSAKNLTYPIADTGQTKCYDNNKEIAHTKAGQAFYGQNGNFQCHPASYKISIDGLTVIDNLTGLTWQRSPDTDGNGLVSSADKLSLTQAQALPAKLNAAKFGGFSDWRLPTIKELYSLILFSGVDVSGPNATDTSSLSPFIDTRFFKFAYGDAKVGERTIDSQWASSTLYVANQNQMFGVNFADGRIKGYGTTRPGQQAKTFFVLCVRGNPNYGRNDFHDNRDGTVTDRATGLIWEKGDSGKGMNWQAALAWAMQKNAANYLGYNDWRLPNAKELQSIVDYSRSPSTTSSAAIDPLLKCTQIKNEIGQADYACYWTGTTHVGGKGGDAAVYVAFGRAAGWMPARPLAEGPPEKNTGKSVNSGKYHFTDVHGAGAQRSDPKIGDPGLFPHGRGPQGDVIRINNFVRCVRAGGVIARADGAEEKATVAFQSPTVEHPDGNIANEHFKRLDKNGDGKILRNEFDGPAEHFNLMDLNKDGFLSKDELKPPPPPNQTRNPNIPLRQGGYEGQDWGQVEIRNK